MSTTDKPTEATTLSPAQSLAITQLGEIFCLLKKQFDMRPSHSTVGGLYPLDASLRDMAFKIWQETKSAPPGMATPGDDDAVGERLLRACRDNDAVMASPRPSAVYDIGDLGADAEAAALAKARAGNVVAPTSAPTSSRPGVNVPIADLVGAAAVLAKARADNVAASAWEVRPGNVITVTGVMDVLRSDGVIVSNNGPYGDTAIKVPTQPPPTAVHGEPGFGIQLSSDSSLALDDDGKTGFWLTIGSARAAARRRFIEVAFSVVSVVRLLNGEVRLSKPLLQQS